MNNIGCLDCRRGVNTFWMERTSGIERQQAGRHSQQDAGLYLQQYNLLPKLNVLDNVEVSMLYGGVPREQRLLRAKRALDRVGLSGKLTHMPNQLSRRRAAACRHRQSPGGEPLGDSGR
jgi:putative ABC transport system ATP-binding protein